MENKALANIKAEILGHPIPIIHCKDCGPVAVPEEQLPVELPRDVEFTGKGNPLETSESFLNVDCPKCGKPARREPTPWIHLSIHPVLLEIYGRNES